MPDNTDDRGSAAELRLWGGRFASGPDAVMAALSRSVQFDWVLAPYDLRQSRAHAGVLERAGLLSPADAQRVRAAIDELSERVQTGPFLPDPADEDVHTAIERGLVELLGPE